MDAHRRQTAIDRQAGSVVIFSALIMVVLAAMATLAVDYGFLQYKRSQLQTAADAAALAGAADLVRYGDNLTAVKAAAVTYGQANLGDQDVVASAVTTDDVEFYKGDAPAAGATPDTVKVTAGRTTVRGNPVDMFLGPLLGWNTQDLTAKASASLFCSNQTKCLKPWAPPAKFDWDSSTDGCADKQDKNGVLDMTSACEVAGVSNVRGYGAEDLGTQIVLKIGDAHDTTVPGHFQPVDYPPNTDNPEKGADTYRLNISSCTGSNNTLVSINDTLLVEPGEMQGPTKQGLDDLMATDPSAYWDSSTNSIKGSAYSDPMASPRVALIPFYDPSIPQQSGRETVKVKQLGAVFVENADKQGNVTGRFIKAMAVDPNRTTGVCDTASVGVYGVGLTK